MSSDIQRTIDRLSEPAIAKAVTAIIGDAADDPCERLALLSEIASEPIEALSARDDAANAIARKVNALEVLARVHGLIA